MSLSILKLGNLGTRRQNVFNHLDSLDEPTKRSKRNPGVYFAHEEGEVTGGGSTTQGQIGQEVTRLTEALGDSSKPVRVNAAWLLGKMGKAAAPAVSELTKLLSDSASDVRVHAVLALGGIGKAAAPAVPELTKALGDSSKPVCVHAARALGIIGREAAPAVPELTKLLGDSNGFIRVNAAEALKEIQRS